MMALAEYEDLSERVAHILDAAAYLEAEEAEQARFEEVRDFIDANPELDSDRELQEAVLSRIETIAEDVGELEPEALKPLVEQAYQAEKDSPARQERIDAVEGGREMDEIGSVGLPDNPSIFNT